MNIKLNPKIIQEMCGTVSFKRGDTFFRTNKVKIEQINSNHCKAVVSGAEDFRVTIEKDEKGVIRPTCSCPRLASFELDCQHIAAVLLTIYENQRQGTTPLLVQETELTKGVMTLFHDQPIRTSAHQRHFENREVLLVQFTCTLVCETQLIGIELMINDNKVQGIRDFLKHVKKGVPCPLSNSFTYNPIVHCFQSETDAILQQIIQIASDEKVYVNPIPDANCQERLLIPPTSWERLVPLLLKAPLVNLESEGQTYDGIQLCNDLLPLKFDFTNDYQLKIDGLSQLLVLEAYDTVLLDGKLFQLETHDCQRLVELKRMLNASVTEKISIPLQQVGYFLEKVVPGLKRLGKVEIAPTLIERFQKIPLMAKLYLDRVKNRLLAGLEFHYENLLINPLENRDLPNGSMLIRDRVKEEEILQIMEESSFAKTDGGYFLHNEELEYEFLYHVMPKLQKLVQIYATTAIRNRITTKTQHPKIRVRVKKERTNWLEFKFEMDGIPDTQIKEILQALEEKRKYYRLRNGSLLSLESKEFAEIQRFLHSPLTEKKDLAGGMDIPMEQCLQLLDTFEENAAFKFEDSFIQILDNIRNPGNLEFEVPTGLEHILKNYQKHGFKWMKTLAYYGFGGILADDMGLGKTIQSIAFIVSSLPEIRQNYLPALIVCPSSLTYNWLSEMMKFAPEIQAVVLDGTKTERTKLQEELKGIDVVITSYPLLRRDIKWYEKQSFFVVFFDEAQSFKNPLTQTSRAVKRLQANHRFALTGTPVENSLEELWSLFHVVFPVLFRGLKEYSMLSRKEIAQRIRPFLLRRMKEDVLSELPEKIEMNESIELLPEQKKLYAAYLAKLRHDTLKHLDKETIRKNRIKILAGLTRLRQICCHPSLFVDGYKGKSAKFEQLLQILEESKLSGRRVLIFSQFTKMLGLIGRELSAKNWPFFYLDGQTPSDERVEICERFNMGERDLFLISLKAGGTGLNLMSADTVILYDTWWNPAVEEQAADRAHRMGQKNVVQVIKLIARGTIEEKMNELQEKKRNLIEEVIDADSKIGATLTDDDLRDILLS